MSAATEPRDRFDLLISCVQFEHVATMRSDEQVIDGHMS